MTDSPAPAPASPLLSIGRQPWQGAVPEKTHYHALSDTLRVYAGWVLAWYIVIVSLESLAELRGFSLLPSFFQEILISC